MGRSALRRHDLLRPLCETAMPEQSPDQRELGRYFALAHVGLEMVVPVGVGMALDYYFGWMPWGVVVGAVLGLIVGITQLVRLSRRMDGNGPDRRERDAR